MAHRAVGLPVTVGGHRVGEVIAAEPARPPDMLRITVRLDGGPDVEAYIDWPEPD